MSEEQAPEKPRVIPSSLVILAGVMTFGFLGWLCWLITRIANAGIAEVDRSTLVQALVIVAAGVVMGGTAFARGTTTGPLAFLGAIFAAVKDMVIKRS